MTEDFLERWYTEGIISRKDFREWRKRPNKILRVVDENFRGKINTFKLHTGAFVEANGFLHPAIYSIRVQFNKHYESLRNKFGYHNVAILSASPTNTVYSIPLLFPIDQDNQKKYQYSWFAKGTYTAHNLFSYDGGNLWFLVPIHIDLLSYEELMTMTPPSISFDDVADMFGERYAPTQTIGRSTLFSLFSSPVYEGRAGGTALSFTTTSSKHACALEDLKVINSDLNAIFSATFQKSPKEKEKGKSKCVKSPLSFRRPPISLKYSFNASGEKILPYLKSRKTGSPYVEVNVSTEPITLHVQPPSSRSELIYKPDSQIQLLKYTDTPLFVPRGNLALDIRQKEMIDYSADIQHLIHYSRIKTPLQEIDSNIRVKTVQKTVRQIRREWPEIEGMANFGILFLPSLVGGMGEHITRLAYGMVRATRLSAEESMNKARELYVENLGFFYEELTPYLRIAQKIIEDTEAETRVREKQRLETLTESALFNLAAVYPDGWAYERFEEEMKTRDISTKHAQQAFKEYHQRGEIIEVRAGIYKRIFGFEKEFH